VKIATLETNRLVHDENAMMISLQLKIEAYDNKMPRLTFSNAAKVWNVFLLKDTKKFLNKLVFCAKSARGRITSEMHFRIFSFISSMNGLMSLLYGTKI